ncbi:MAG: OmpA family protein [Elusimicrobiota bacterium]
MIFFLRRRGVPLGCRLAISAALAFAAGPSSGSELSHFSPRASGMGGAYGAVSDDAGAVFFNPAGLRLIKKTELDLAYGKPFTGAKGVELWSGAGTFAVSGKSWGSAAVSWTEASVQDLFSEKNLILSYAHGLPLAGRPLRLGASWRRVRQDYDLDARAAGDPVFRSGDDAAASAYDIGALYGFGPEERLRLGAAVRSVNEPDIGFQQSVPLPRSYRLGLSYLLPAGRLGADFLPAFDALWIDGRRDYFMGMEARLRVHPLALRAGTNIVGDRGRDAALGFGYALPLAGNWKIILDYAFLYPLRLEETSGSHVAGFKLRFQEAPKKPVRAPDPPAPAGPADTDGDGVADKADACPDTPAGTTVDRTGCAVDADLDGTPDGQDQCPGTPEGAVADACGCPSDSDGDGVWDGLDRCPGTPQGIPVDAAGCPAAPREGQKISVKLRVEFASGRTDINSDFDQDLRDVAAFLKAHPEVTTEIEGHTDSQGASNINILLSQKRAESVRSRLIALGVEASRLTAKGYGPFRPVADNATPEGRQKNRRVVATMTATKKR